jgi:hypothetical protein
LVKYRAGSSPASLMLPYHCTSLGKHPTGTQSGEYRPRAPDAIRPPLHRTRIMRAKRVCHSGQALSWSGVSRVVAMANDIRAVGSRISPVPGIVLHWSTSESGDSRRRGEAWR